ncbi:MAG: aspartate-semialdehyde dehydrogenase [Deltaproteobacteria bacterium]|nr:aspartate-semialdehyde dehydrogenase [Deltaproteobacteria bacterium]
MSEGFRTGIVGATGAVGREVLKILESREFRVASVRPFSSAIGRGSHIPFRGGTLVAEELMAEETFKDLDIVFFAASGQVSRQFVPRALEAGAFVIDNSSHFRMHADVPLVVPEINGALIRKKMAKRLIANPNCTTAQMVMALKPLQDAFGLKRVVLSSYQAVSGKGQKGIDEFLFQAEDVLAGRPPEVRQFPHPIAFNCIPHVDVFEEEGFTGEEHKVMNETRKILGDDSIRVSATCVRVPVVNGHSESVSIETAKPVTPDEARAVLAKMPGVRVVDDPASSRYPLATDASGKDEVLVGRVRPDPSLEEGKHGLLLWIVADNLRKGAALNAVQIAEKVAEVLKS